MPLEFLFYSTCVCAAKELVRSSFYTTTNSQTWRLINAQAHRKTQWKHVHVYICCSACSASIAHNYNSQHIFLRTQMEKLPVLKEVLSTSIVGNKWTRRKYQTGGGWRQKSPEGVAEPLHRTLFSRCRCLRRRNVRSVGERHPRPPYAESLPPAPPPTGDAVQGHAALRMAQRK